MPCLVDRLQPGKQFPLLPKYSEDSSIAPPNCCIHPDDHFTLYVKVVNVAATQEVLYSSEQIVELKPNFPVTVESVGWV